MAKNPKFRKDGGPDGRGQAAGSRASQFAAGDGRTRPGRSKGAKSLSRIYREAAQMPVAVSTAGKTKRITTAEAVVLTQREKAPKGHDRAAERFIERVDQFSPPEVEHDLTARLCEEDAELLAATLGRGGIGWDWQRETGSGPGAAAEAQEGVDPEDREAEV